MLCYSLEKRFQTNLKVISDIKYRNTHTIWRIQNVTKLCNSHNH